jgi:hypothetical protein
MKAIETRYNNYRFRSRLEARWAVFFDTLGVPYEYEREGFELGGVYYLPDFWLPEQQCWVEIKPESVFPLGDEVKKWQRLAEHQTCFVFVGEIKPPVVHLLGSAGAEYQSYISDGSFAMALLPTENGEFKSDYDPRPWYWHERQDGSFVIWPNPAFELPPEGYKGVVMRQRISDADGTTLAVVDPIVAKTKQVDSPKLMAAYAAARQARFEHGEQGAWPQTTVLTMRN